MCGIVGIFEIKGSSEQLRTKALGNVETHQAPRSGLVWYLCR